MNKFLRVIMILALLGAAITPGIAEAPPRVLDDFEDGNITAAPAWWTFDGVMIDLTRNVSTVVTTIDNKKVYIGNTSLSLAGATTNWYIGGLGTYLGIDAGDYLAFEIDVYGYGPKSGLLKIELVDDDNHNWIVEQDTANAYIPTMDDRVAAEIPITWNGWKHVVIQMIDFTDNNPGMGNDKWDPAQLEGSGGLLTCQIILLGNGKVGSVGALIDNIRLSIR